MLRLSEGDSGATAAERVKVVTCTFVQTLMNAKSRGRLLAHGTTCSSRRGDRTLVQKKVMEKEKARLTRGGVDKPIRKQGAAHWVARESIKRERPDSLGGLWIGRHGVT